MTRQRIRRGVFRSIVDLHTTINALVPLANPLNGSESRGWAALYHDSIECVRVFIEGLLFAALLLLSAAVYGVNSTAQLTAQLVPVGSAPPIPAGAQATGFTTSAFETDFYKADTVELARLLPAERRSEREMVSRLSV
jgi:hypothetical protein